MSSLRSDLIAENERLRGEVERLHAQLAAKEAKRAGPPRRFPSFNPHSPESRAWLAMLAKATTLAAQPGFIETLRAPAAPAVETDNSGASFAEPAPASDPMAVYLPPTVATAAAVARAEAIAAGELVELPTDPVARQILRADRRAREPGSDPL
jgi:hypothetical protein